MVEDVEEVGARLQPQALGDLELPLQGEINLGRAEAAQGIASQIALAAGGVKAALLMIFPPGAVGSERYKGTPGTTFGRWTLLAPETKVPGKGFFPVTTFTGGALRAYT